MKIRLNTNKLLKRAGILLLAIILLLVALSSQFHFLGDSITTILHADNAYVLWAISLALMSYVTATYNYMFLSYTSIRFFPSLLIQIADGFTNRLLPASAGGLATNYLYLVKQKHTKAQASIVVAADDLLGFFGHASILCFLLLTESKTYKDMFVWQFPFKLAITLAILAIFIVIAILIGILTKTYSSKQFKNIFHSVAYLLLFPSKLISAFTSSMATTATYTAILYFSLLSVNIHVTLFQAFVALSIGIVTMSVSPTPGGIGGAEAGLVAALNSMGVPLQQALSAALVYRFITFWLPIIPGFIAFQTVLKKGYIKSTA